jgi:transposase
MARILADGQRPTSPQVPHSMDRQNFGERQGDVARFRSIRQAISYCGLCGDEKSSADKVIRTPLSKQRNEHIQRVLVEAAN